jgi:hypothetical protein
MEERPVLPEERPVLKDERRVLKSEVIETTIISLGFS